MKVSTRIKLKVAASKALVLIGGIFGIWLLVVVIALTMSWLSSLGWAV